MFTAGTSMGQVIQNAQQRFMALRKALEDAADFYAWISAQSLADLENLGFTAADAQALMNAAADANELANLYNGGALGTYTLPYNFSATQRQVIGAQ